MLCKHPNFCNSPQSPESLCFRTHRNLLNTSGNAVPLMKSNSCREMSPHKSETTTPRLYHQSLGILLAPCCTSPFQRSDCLGIGAYHGRQLVSFCAPFFANPRRRTTAKRGKLPRRIRHRILSPCPHQHPAPRGALE